MVRSMRPSFARLGTRPVDGFRLIAAAALTYRTAAERLLVRPLFRIMDCVGFSIFPACEAIPVPTFAAALGSPCLPCLFRSPPANRPQRSESRVMNVFSCQASRVLLFALALLFTISSARAEQPIEYNRDVRPILIDACISCHGPDSASRQADLRLDRRDDAVELAAIVPGDPDSSEMIRRILSEDVSEVMPPPETKKHLTAEQKETLNRWIKEGAEYQPHWSLIAPTRPTPPVSTANADWVRNPIDAFVLTKLEAAGLTPAPEADRHTLARRAALDLTGLPPTPEQVAEFLADESPDAYEK